jgi:low affinity Fe/Cu permease
MQQNKSWFRVFAHKTSEIVGSSLAFFVAVVGIIIWLVTGPFFHYSDTWQLIINTATTIITFLMVFLIQNSQNRDARAIQIKLNELLRGVSGARTSLVNLEELEDDELEKLHNEFKELHEKIARKIRAREATKSGVE